jgi:hypothetical protein
VTVVVGVTGTGWCPDPGSRLRTLARRLIIAAGLAALGWLCAAALGTATASADTPPPTDDLLGVVGATADTVTDTLDGTVGTVTDAVTNTVTTATDTVAATTTDVVHAVVPAVSPVVPAKPVVHHHAVVHPVVPKAVRVTASRHAPIVHHHATAVVSHVVTPVAQARPHVAPAVHRPDAPLRAPPPKAPQAPGPVVPAGSVGSAHGTGGVARHALVPRVVTLADPSCVGGSGWAAATAVLAARGQGLPAASPD